MKLLLIMVTLFATNAFACPMLTGNYTCHRENGSQVLNKQITNTEKGYIINTDGNEMEYFTDGKGYSIPATDSYQNAKVVSSCNGEIFNTVFTAEILYEGSVIAREVALSNYAFEGDKLVLTQKTKMKGLPMPSNRYICTRN